MPCQLILKEEVEWCTLDPHGSGQGPVASSCETVMKFLANTFLTHQRAFKNISLYLMESVG